MSKKDIVWNKAEAIRGKDPKRYRRDRTGRTIYYYAYGLNTPMGWVKDHIISKYDGGSDKPCNLQALQTKQNLIKGKKSWENDCEPSLLEDFVKAGVIFVGTIAIAQITSSIINSLNHPKISQPQTYR